MDTKTSIKNSFIKIYSKKDLSQITVSRLCAAVPVARTTFYAYYDNIDSVRCEIEDDLIGGLMEITDNVSQGNLSEMDFNAFLGEIERYIKQNWGSFQALLIQQPDRRFIAKWKDCIKLNFSRRYPEKVNIKNYALISEMVASSVIGAYSFLLTEPERVSTEELKNMITNVLNAIVNTL